jgi:aryl-alcohol dehydrogenase-like predicted oxidoreductase/enamine deaminase RidA (YjgF/YER057c/UK114 family)
MIYSNVPLSKTLTISPIITGMWQIADMERNGKSIDKEKAVEDMLHYVESGFTTFDMADHYGTAEEVAGLFNKKYEGQYHYQMLTKWVPPPGKITQKEVENSVQKALDRLQTSSLDLLQFHAWNYADPSWLDTLFMLQEIQEKGHIKNLGVTNFDAIHLEMALQSGIPLVSNQISHSMLDRRALNEWVSLCKKYGIHLLAYGTLAGGLLSDRWLGQENAPKESNATWSQMKYFRFIQAAGGWNKFKEVLLQLRTLMDSTPELRDQSLALLAARFALENPAVGAIIIGARLGSSTHLAENKKILEQILPQEKYKTILSLVNQLAPIPGDCGDEYRKPPFLTASGDLSHHIQNFPSPYEVVTDTRGVQRVYSGTPWEPIAGYCRAIKTKNTIKVSGTTATLGQRLIGGHDPAAQTHFIIDKIEGALQSLGAELGQVVRTRVFISDTSFWRPVAEAMGKRFANHHPTNTMVGAPLIGEEYLVEIEAEAEITEN